jgi:hypothetical protein
MIDANYPPAIAALEPKNRYPALLKSELALGMLVVLSEPDSVGR